MEKRFIALVLDIESFIRDNSLEMLELATENGDYPAIKDYCEVVGHYDTEGEALTRLKYIGGETLIYDTLKQELSN